MPRKYTRKNKRYRRKNKRGGSDIESGAVENVSPMSSIPPDPERFQTMNQQIVSDSFKPISNEEAASVFDGPNPQEKLHIEEKMMANEDPLNKDPFDNEDLTIFSTDRGGKRTKKRRRNKRKSSTRRRR